ncbi:precorrin-2 dehydrogenase/sirohydrochlorin ferrochelatase family protein [Salinirussus salinus]|uniref:precorrin-2 dehydrogenase/sirohydrochlorin ferrochelatase family protein n=1 Tax=Salinirussus salinus TaxID=1198300 RepID=UPI0013587255|nr:NAD(P)-dependent oxidoreductase [Salinirussus salinus]
MIPLLHDFAGERVLVFGGGAVGARKARRFAREAEVVVLAPDFPGEFGDGGGAGSLELVRAAPAPGDVAGWLDRVEPALAVAATDDAAVNDAVERAAGERGVLVNRADRSRVDRGEEAGTPNAARVVVPATVRDGPVVASVATGGRAPALSRRLRRDLEGVVDGAGELAEVTAELRAELRDSAPEERRAAVRAVVDSDAVWKALDTPDDNLRKTARAVISDVTGDPG